MPTPRAYYKVCDENETLKAELCEVAEADLELLKNIEWGHYRKSFLACPDCESSWLKNGKHKSDCKLAARIKKLEEIVGEGK